MARSIAQKESSNRLELAGDGPGRTQLENLFTAYGMKDRFCLLGHVDNMASFYSSLDLYLNTSQHEGIPMTILEAMGHGFPVIAPAVGRIREIIISGQDGFLIDSRDAHTFAGQCLRLYRDEHLRRAIAIAVCDKVERNFSVGKMAEDYYKLYCQVIQSAHRR